MIDFAPLLEKLRAMPNVTSTTPGPKCPQCGTPFLVVYARRSKGWMLLHSRKHDCRIYGIRYMRETQEEALEIAEQIQNHEA